MDSVNELDCRETGRWLFESNDSREDEASFSIMKKNCFYFDEYIGGQQPGRFWEWQNAFDGLQMTAQYSFLSTCQQIAAEELGQLDLGVGPPALVHQSGQQEQKVKKREKLLSLFGGLLPTKPHVDPDGKENAADQAHERKRTRFNLLFGSVRF